MTREQRLRLNGVRSGLERDVRNDLNELGVDAQYEPGHVPYTKPAQSCKYTPDFILPNGIIIETKGRFLVADRAKHLMIKEQYGDTLDIRFVFTRSKQKIYKGSKTSYADWCKKFGFTYHDKEIPLDWINEEKKTNPWEILVVKKQTKK